MYIYKIFFKIDYIFKEILNILVWMFWGRKGLGGGRGNEWIIKYKVK